MLLSGLATSATRVLFFTGKGGVGKTSVACALAVHLARLGRRVLLVSTDPASNLDEVLGQALSPSPTPIEGVPGLSAANLDPVAAAAAWKERVVGPYRGLLPISAIHSMEEQLSGACTVEIAAFDAFSKMIVDPASRDLYDHLLFDTAPTGHTLRLLSLPAAWSGFLATHQGAASCVGPLAGLDGQRARYAETATALQDPLSTTLVLVSRPEPSALKEAERSRQELRTAGLDHVLLVVNGRFQPAGANDPLALAFASRGDAAVEGMPAGLAGLPRVELPLLGAAPMGLAGLDLLLSPPPVSPVPVAALGAPEELAAQAEALKLPPPLSALVDELARAGHGVILTMGKGGVGKTTVAAALAVALARRGLSVQLSTTDPAAHVAAAVDGPVPGLTVGRIDPVAETEAYRAEVLAGAGADLDEAGRALLNEDLASPCTAEIAIFRAFARTVEAGVGGFVVLDTAPTGHTLLLLDASEAFHREVTRSTGAVPEAVRSLLPRLRDPDFTRVLLVTLPEATPVHEAAMLGRDLERAHIHPFAWVINGSLLPHHLTDPVLLARREHEHRWVEEVQSSAVRVLLIPYQVEPPVGVERLLRLLDASPDGPSAPA